MRTVALAMVTVAVVLLTPAFGASGAHGGYAGRDGPVRTDREQPVRTGSEGPGRGGADRAMTGRAGTLPGARVSIAYGADEILVYLPLAFRRADVSQVPRAEPDTPAPLPSPSPGATSTVGPSETPGPTEPPPPTETIAIPPTITPEASPSATSTAPADASRIHGRILVKNSPIAEGFGLPGGPQIELRKCTRVDRPCVGDEWEAVDRTVVVARGLFAFDNPPPLGEGEQYQVWWVNDFEHVEQATSDYLGRWWSRPIARFGAGDDVDVGTFELADLKLKEICHDCLSSLPITFKWTRRTIPSEDYQWSLFRGCGSIAKRYEAWRTGELGHAGQYELEATPPTFRLNEKYCWYVFIESAGGGTGWSFDDWRVTFLPTPGNFLPRSIR